MTNPLRDKWVAALRSGKYFQGFGRFKQAGRLTNYCAIGVLCNLIDEKSWTLDFRSNLIEGIYLPKDAAPWLLPEHYAMIYFMNDNQKKSFSEIADYIEGL